MRLSLRILAVFEGLVGALVGFAISITASILRVIGGAVGISTDQAHFFLAIALSLLAFVGALLAIGPGLVAAICLLVAGVGFFFVAGWWGIIPALFLLPAAWLAYISRTPAPAPVAAPQPQPALSQPLPATSEPLRQPSTAESHWRAEAPTITESAQPALPEAQPVAPEAQPALPEAQPITPEAQPITPEAKPVTPEAQPAAPQAQPHAETPTAELPPIEAERPPEEAPVGEAPPEQPEPQPRREAQRLTEPPPDTSLPGAPA